MDHSDEGIADAFQMAEYLNQLKTKNESEVKELNNRIERYEHARDTVLNINQTTRHKMMAPVCGGLGYFEVEIRPTNEVTVLLGDNWFAERTASQTVEIAERRLAFLRREKKVLQEELNSAEAKLTMFAEEATGAPPPQSIDQSSGDVKAKAATQGPEAAAARGQTTSGGEEDDDEDIIGDEDEDLTIEEIMQLEEQLAAESEASGEPLSDEWIEAAIKAKVKEKRRAMKGSATEGVGKKDNEGNSLTAKMFDDVPDPLAAPEPDAPVPTAVTAPASSSSGASSPVTGSSPRFTDPSDLFSKMIPSSTNSEARPVGTDAKKVSFAPGRDVQQPVVGAPAAAGKDVVIPSSTQRDIICRDDVVERPKVGSSSSVSSSSSGGGGAKRQSRFRKENM